MDHIVEAMRDLLMNCLKSNSKLVFDDNEGENMMFNQGFEQLHENAHIRFKLENERLWWATYLEMHSINQDGSYCDLITDMCSDMCSTRLLLFI